MTIESIVIKTRRQLADAAKAYQWDKVLEILSQHPHLANSTRPGGTSPRLQPLGHVGIGSDREMAISYGCDVGEIDPDGIGDGGNGALLTDQDEIRRCRPLLQEDPTGTLERVALNLDYMPAGEDRLLELLLEIFVGARRKNAGSRQKSRRNRQKSREKHTPSTPIVNLVIAVRTRPSKRVTKLPRND